MKSLKPLFYLVSVMGIASMSLVHAAGGLDTYRMGKYDKAAIVLGNNASKDPMADYYIGRMQLYGYGLLKNNDKALAHIKQAASGGYTPAQKFMARYALSIENNPDDAFQWFRKLAIKDDDAAKMYVIGAYKYGYGVKKNQQKARRIYIRESKDGNAITQYILARDFLSSRYRSNRKLGLIWLKKSVAQGYPRAQTYLAQLYLSGKQVRKNESKAVDLMFAAADNNYVPAMLKMAELAGKNKQPRVAETWWKKAADAGNAKAMLALAALYFDEKSSLHDPEVGFQWTHKAAEETPSVAAKKALASLYKEGQGVTADAALAKKWEAKAKVAEKDAKSNKIARQMARFVTGDKTSGFADTRYYLYGILANWQNPSTKKQAQYNAFPGMEGVKPAEIFDPQFKLVKPDEIDFTTYFYPLAMELRANASREWRFPRYPVDKQIQQLMNNEMLIYPHKEWQSMVAEGSPYPDAPYNGSWNYIEQQLTGWRQRANLYVVVMRLYNQAILGNSNAQFEIGQLYHYGIGVAKNAKQAKLYYELAAEQDDVRAEYNLGVLYLNGLVQPEDYDKGMAWLTDAAFRGNAYAQYALANIYQYGYTDQSGRLVVEPDEKQAISMYYLSSANRFGPAQYKLANALVAQHDHGLTVTARENRAEIAKKLYTGAADEGVADAFLPKAFYLAMDPDSEKQRQAFVIAQKEAKGNNPQAPLLLGLMYDRGIGVKADPVKALYWYQQAGNSPVKDFVLGTYYSVGEGVNKNTDRARKLFRQAAKGGFSYGGVNLAVLKQQANQPFQFDLIQAHADGNAHASLLLADYYLAQNDRQNFDQARDIYTHLAEKGERDAQLKLGYLHASGKIGNADYTKAAHWLKNAAEQGQPMAQFLLANLYQLGKTGKEPDVQAAIKWYTAAQEHMPRAAIAAGFLYDTALDDYGQAMISYQLAANHDHPLGQYNLGLLYEYGKGMPVDMATARKWYTLAAKQQQPQAMTRLGMLYLKGAGGRQNDAAALNWLNRASTAGDRNAAYQMGLLAETGIGRKLDFGDAVKYYQQAAKEGDVKANLALARIYQYGLNGQPKPDKARAIYRELARKGNGFAQYQLAVMQIAPHLDDKGWSEVKDLLKKSQTNGNHLASVLLQKINAMHNSGPSFIEPLWLNRLPFAHDVSADRYYREALNEWNQGDIDLSRMKLERLQQAYPQYAPAQKAYEQISQL